MLNAAQLIQALHEKGYALFDGGPYDLNLVALRRVPGTLDAFDDLLVALYRTQRGGPWAVEAFGCTTDPGKPSFANSKRRLGAPFVALGQHRGAYTFGRHKGTYRCLVPAKPIPVVRYKTEDDYRAGRGTPSTSDLVQIHRANASRRSTVVSTWSEGCIVVADPKDFARLLELCDLQAARGLGSRYTLTVLDWNFQEKP